MKITSLPIFGTLKKSGVAISEGDYIAESDIDAGYLAFTPDGDANGSPFVGFYFQVKDDGGTTGGGIDLDPTPRLMAIEVTAVNDAPVNSVPASQTTGKNTNLVFSTGNGNLISIADVDAGSSTVQVALTATNGDLTLSGTSGLSFSFTDGNGTGAGDGTADATMTFRGTIANINAALAGLNFAPTNNYTGSASVQIVTNDLGNTGSGGALTDSDTIAVTVVYPWVSGLSQSTGPTAGGVYSITITGLGFTGASAVKFGTLDATSYIVNSDTSITATVPGSSRQTVHVTVTTSNGTSPTCAESVFTYINGAPSGANNTVTGYQNTDYTFLASDFGFSDLVDSPYDSFYRVLITSLAQAGTLLLDGVAVTAGQYITVADINSGKLKFRPATNSYGNNYASFGFRVQDDGGTDNGGIDLDPTERIMTININQGL